MKVWLNKLSRKERIYLLVCAVVVLLGGVVYPVAKKAMAARAEQMDEVIAQQELVQDYQQLLKRADEIEQEHAKLSSALSGLGYVMYTAESANALQTQLVQDFGEMAPSLELDVSSGRAVRKNNGQLNLNVSARGTYARLLSFMNELETNEPLICIDSVKLYVKTQRSSHRRGPRGSTQTVATPTTQPDMTIQLKLHVNYRQESSS